MAAPCRLGGPLAHPQRVLTSHTGMPKTVPQPLGRLRPMLLAALLSACSSNQFDGHTYRSSQLSFRVRHLPPEWRALRGVGPLLAFRDDAGLASIAVSGRCGRDGDDVPLESLTHHLFLHFTEREIEHQERLPLDGREALYTELTAKLDGVRKRYAVYVLKKNGCVYDFVHVAEETAPPQSRERFTTFVQGFSTLEP